MDKDEGSDPLLILDDTKVVYPSKFSLLKNKVRNRISSGKGISIKLNEKTVIELLLSTNFMREYTRIDPNTTHVEWQWYLDTNTGRVSEISIQLVTKNDE